MDLSITVNGIKFPNPFLLGSGPPGTNARVLAKSYDAGWGGAVAKTVSLESSKVVNVVPRYGKLRSRNNGEVIGFENIELISDRPIEIWLEEFRQVKKEYPNNILIASIMEEYSKDRWQELTRVVQDTGVDGFELNFSCPHGMTERRMGSEMGEHPDLTEEVTSWVTEVSKIPVWAKMTPNITNIKEPSLAAVRGGAKGISAINTILSVIGVNLDTLRPMPTVEGYTVPGGYSAQAVKPIALRMVSQLGLGLPEGITISGIGGVESSRDAIFFSRRSRHTILQGDWSSDVCFSDLMIRHTRLQGDWSSDVCSSDLNGLVVKPADAPGIVESVTRLAESAELRARLGRAAQETMRRHTWEHMARQVEKIFALAVAGAGRPGEGRLLQ